MNRWNCGRDSFFRKRPVCRRAVQLDTFFARSTPVMVTYFMDSLSFLL